MPTTNKTIAVIGATGAQGGGVVRALKERGQFRVRALTRNPGAYKGAADEVVEADLNRPETLKAAFRDAYGVFVVTNFWEPGTNELAQGKAAVDAAKAAGVEHFVWSTLPDVVKISGGKYAVPHFTGKAKVDKIVESAGFANYTFVMAPFFYQNLTGMLAPQPQQDGSIGWALPIDPAARTIHMGDISELGDIVAGAFARPGKAGNGQYLPLVGDLLSFDDIVATLGKQDKRFTFKQVPTEIFSTLFEGAAELAQTFGYFENHTYLGADYDAQIKLAEEIVGKPATDFASWAEKNFDAVTLSKST